jgi:adenylate kinase
MTTRRETTLPTDDRVLWFRGVAAVILFSIAGLASAQLSPSPVLILIGPPGSGKTVQAKALSKTYKVPTISMASLLKQELGKKTPLASALAGSIASGDLVSDDAANEVMRARLLRPDASRGFILDGYPTTEKQAVALDEFIKENGFATATVIILAAPDDQLRERMSLRERQDDTPENIERRLREYRSVQALTEQHYGPDSTVRVDATGDVRSVSSAIARQVDEIRSRKKLLTRPEGGTGLIKRAPESK